MPRIRYSVLFPAFVILGWLFRVRPALNGRRQGRIMETRVKIQHWHAKR
jgi:hypothetical protein